MLVPVGRGGKKLAEDSVTKVAAPLAAPKSDLMSGDVTLAGFTLTQEEWEALDPESRQQLLEADREGRDPASPLKPLARGTVPPGARKITQA